MTEKEYKEQLEKARKQKAGNKYLTASKKEYDKLSKSEQDIFDGLSSKFAGAGKQILLKAQDLEPNEAQSEEALEFLKSLDEVPEEEEEEEVQVNPVERYKEIQKAREELKDDPVALYKFNKSL